jgi:hypothetical protein
MNHHPSPSTNPTFSSPRTSLVESLARAILLHERLTPRELPRCRREVRLQLTVSRLHLAGSLPYPPRTPAAS